jgi:hypothetical protein
LAAPGDQRPGSLTDAKTPAAEDRVVAVNLLASSGIGSYGQVHRCQARRGHHARVIQPGGDRRRPRSLMSIGGWG